MADASGNAATSAGTERRIANLTLVFGALGAAVGGYYSRRYAAGLTVGALLAWLNFRLLQRGMDILVASASDSAGPRPQQAQVFAALATAGRYALLGLAIYVIFKVSGVPILSMALGLCALGAAATVAGLYEILHSSE